MLESPTPGAELVGSKSGPRDGADGWMQDESGRNPDVILGPSIEDGLFLVNIFQRAFLPLNDTSENNLSPAFCTLRKSAPVFPLFLFMSAHVSANPQHQQQGFYSGSLGKPLYAWRSFRV